MKIKTDSGLWVVEARKQEGKVFSFTITFYPENGDTPMEVVPPCFRMNETTEDDIRQLVEGLNA